MFQWAIDTVGEFARYAEQHRTSSSVWILVLFAVLGFGGNVLAHWIYPIDVPNADRSEFDRGSRALALVVTLLPAMLAAGYILAWVAYCVQQDWWPSPRKSGGGALAFYFACVLLYFSLSKAWVRIRHR